MRDIVRFAWPTMRTYSYEMLHFLSHIIASWEFIYSLGICDKNRYVGFSSVIFLIKLPKDHYFSKKIAYPFLNLNFSDMISLCLIHGNPPASFSSFDGLQSCFHYSWLFVWFSDSSVSDSMGQDTNIPLSPLMVGHHMHLRVWILHVCCMKRRSVWAAALCRVLQTFALLF